MKHNCNCALRDFMSKQLKEVRTKADMTQTQFAEHPKMDTRSYAALEQADSLCCIQIFILFLAAFCPDSDALIQKLQEIILTIYEEESVS